jgi:hypothetical protein
LLRTVITLLPAFICAGVMLVICLPMIRGPYNAGDEGTREEVAALREEVARLHEAEERREASQAQEASLQ